MTSLQCRGELPLDSRLSLRFGIAPRRRHQIVVLVPRGHDLGIGYLPQLLVELRLVRPVPEPVDQVKSVDTLIPGIGSSRSNHLGRRVPQAIRINPTLNRCVHACFRVGRCRHKGFKLCILIEELAVSMALCDQHIDNPTSQPFTHIQSDSVTARQARRHPDHQFAILATCFDRPVHPLYPITHDSATRIDFARMEIVQAIIQLQFKAINGITIQSLLDQGKSFLTYLRMLEIQHPRAGKLGGHIIGSTDFQVGILKPEVRATGILPPLTTPLLHQQRRIQQHSLRVRPVTDQLQWIVAILDQLFCILIGPAKNQVGPFLHIVAPEFAHLGVMQYCAAVAQAKHDDLDRRPDQFINGRLVLLFLNGGLVHVDQRMPTVMVEHHPWSAGWQRDFRTVLGGFRFRLFTLAPGDDASTQRPFEKISSHHHRLPPSGFTQSYCNVEWLLFPESSA